MYSERQAWTNSVDPDEMPQNVADAEQTIHMKYQVLFYLRSNWKK